jgi:hypothetical protein
MAAGIQHHKSSEEENKNILQPRQLFIESHNYLYLSLSKLRGILKDWKMFDRLVMETGEENDGTKLLLSRSLDTNFFQVDIKYFNKINTEQSNPM